MKNLKNLQNYFTLVNSEKPPIFPIYPSLTPGNQSLTPRVHTRGKVAKAHVTRVLQEATNELMLRISAQFHIIRVRKHLQRRHDQAYDNIAQRATLIHCILGRIPMVGPKIKRNLALTIRNHAVEPRLTIRDPRRQHELVPMREVS